MRLRLAVPVAAPTLLLTLAVTPRAQTPDPAREIENVAAFARLYGVVRYFHPGDTAARLDWDRFAVHGVSVVRPAPDAAALAAALRKLFGPLGPGITVAEALGPPPPQGPPDRALVAWRYRGPGIAVLPKNNPYSAWRTNRTKPPPNAGPDASSDAMLPVTGAYADVVLGRALRARVLLALSDAQAASEPDPEGARVLAEAVAPRPAADQSRDENLADAVVAWNVFRHFYPYWREVAARTKTDWDERLPVHLRLAYEATTADAQREAIQALVADAHDGHGSAREPKRRPSATLPIHLRVVEGKVTVTASAIGELAVGATIASIDGVNADRRLADAMRLESGTAQWREVRALRELTVCRSDAPVTIVVETALGQRSVAATCGTAPAPAEKRPDEVREVSPGIWYVDLTRARFGALEPVLPKLSQARGVVFDLRGYPTDAGAAILPYLLPEPERDRWMHVARIVGPFGTIAGYDHFGWDLQPKAPKIGGTVVFLTDGRAISYAESVMGYVADRKLGTIVGASTAGTNGNVALVSLPSGRLAMGFTGMLVTRHDGRTPFHLEGVTPDVPAVPTLAGVRSGRDDVLERGLEIARGTR
jgi:hypothetical protein